MEIVQPDLAGEKLIARHGPGEFTGEMTMISGRRSHYETPSVDEDDGLWHLLEGLVEKCAKPVRSGEHGFEVRFSKPPPEIWEWGDLVCLG